MKSSKYTIVRRSTCNRRWLAVRRPRAHNCNNFHSLLIAHYYYRYTSTCFSDHNCMISCTTNRSKAYDKTSFGVKPCITYCTDVCMKGKERQWRGIEEIASNLFKFVGVQTAFDATHTHTQIEHSIVFFSIYHLKCSFFSCVETMHILNS